MKNKALRLYTNENTGVCAWECGDRHYTSEPGDEHAWEMMSTTHQMVNESSDPDTRGDMIQGIKLLLKLQGTKRKK